MKKKTEKYSFIDEVGRNRRNMRRMKECWGKYGGGEGGRMIVGVRERKEKDGRVESFMMTAKATEQRRKRKKIDGGR